MTIRDELLAIQRNSADGMLHCGAAIRWAKENPDSRLAKHLEWDNEVAGHEHRLSQVRQLIQLYITSSDDTESLVSLSIDRRAGGGYRSVSDVVARVDLREIMLRDALDELERVQAKYQRVEALAAVWREAATVRKTRRAARAEERV